jgi:predicted RNase H-like HicB family nuclease
VALECSGESEMHQARVLTYRVWLTKEPEGGYTVTVPSLPGCVTYGESVDEAVLMAREAIELYLESLKAHGEPIPTEDAIFEYTVTVPAYA